MNVLTALALSFSAATCVRAQESDQNYFDFWPGTWVMEVNGKPDTSQTTFRVRRGVHPYSFEEEWRMVTDVDVVLAKGMRVWEKEKSTWWYLWVSNFSHYQLWESRKVGNHWYIYKTFNINGDEYLSA